MKKIIFSLVTATALIFASCNNDSDSNDTPANSSGKRLVKITEKSSYSNTNSGSGYNNNSVMELTYGTNGFVSKIISTESNKELNDNGDTFTSTSTKEFEFTYNDNNQVAQSINYGYFKGGKIETEKTIYTYNTGGYIIESKNTYTESYDNTSRVLKRTFEYNDNNLMSKESSFSYEVGKEGEAEPQVTIYEYDSNNILVKSYNKDKPNNITTYTFDDKKNPLYNLATDKLSLINPAYESKYNLTKKISTNIYSYNGNTETSTYTTNYSYLYDNDGYPTKRTRNYEKENNIEESETTEYLYE